MGFDASKLGAMITASQDQKVIKGVQKSKDPDFPVFGTPLNEDVLLYIPKTNMVVDENGEQLQILHSVIHDYKEGKAFGSTRCIRGLNDEVYKELGYDGDCPFCKAMNECWDLYNKKIALKAKEVHLEKNSDGSWDDPNNLLEPFKKAYMREMAINQPTEYVTFPIVVIPKAPNSAKPAEDAMEKMKVYWLHWRKQRYEEKLIKPLDSLEENPGHPAGLVWLAKYTYDTKGQKPDPMLAAKNASYSICQNQTIFKDLIIKAEEMAKPFTLIKAVETVIAVDFLSSDDMKKKVDTIMKDTRAKLAVLSSDKEEVKAIASNAEKALEQFAVTGVSDAPNTGEVNTQNNTGDLGVSPVKFD